MAEAAPEVRTTAEKEAPATPRRSPRKASPAPLKKTNSRTQSKGKSPAKGKKTAKTAKEAKPKKVVKTKTSKNVKVKKLKTKPTYEVMVIKAIQGLNKKFGVSLFGIVNWVRDRYPVPEDVFKRYLKRTLHLMVEDGKLLKVRQSYRLSPRGRHLLDKKKKRKTAKKTAKTTKKADAPETKKKTVKKTKTTGKKAAAKEDDGKKKAKPKRKNVKDTTKAKKDGAEKKKRTVNVGSKKARAAKQKDARIAAAAPAADAASGLEIAPSSSAAFQWQYWDNGWKNYDTAAAVAVEAIYEEYEKDPGMFDVRSVKSGKWMYQVDFRNMEQTNLQHEAHTVRKIRRVPVGSM